MTTPTLALGQPALEKQAAAADDLILHSVTSIIGVLDKPALVWWSGDEVAKEAIRVAGSLETRLREDGEAQTFKWLREARFRSGDRLTGAALGSAFHGLAEGYALTGQRPDSDAVAAAIRSQNDKLPSPAIASEAAVLAQMLNQFDGWLQRFTPTYQATEVAVYHPTYGYAGQADGFATVGGVRFLIDYKTTREPLDSKGKPRKPYPEQVGLQLAAYRHAEQAAVWRPRRTERYRTRYYLLSPAEQALAQPVPEVDAGLVIHVTPEACEAFPIRCDKPVFDAFLYVLEAYRWMQDTSKTVMGDPLEEA